MLQPTQPQNTFSQMNAMSGMSSENVSPTYCPPDFNAIRDSGINMDSQMSNGLGITQPDGQPHMLSQDFAMGNQMAMAGHGMQKQSSQQQHSINHENTDDDNSNSNRRTLTQAQFDAFGQGNPFDANSTSLPPSMSATITNPSDLYGHYDFPDLCDFNFDSAAANEVITSTPMQPSMSTDSYSSSMLTQSQSASSDQGQVRTVSARSDSSTPSLRLTPAQQDMDPFDFQLPNQPSSEDIPPVPPIPASMAQWQPGQSIPVDLARLQREFEEAAMRNRNQSVPVQNNQQFMEQPLAYPSDEDFNRRESSTTHLTRSMQNFTMAGQRSAMPSTSIAARRQRPRPAPLGGASLRSTSYCGQLPISPGPAGGNHNLQSAGQSLRRIKSSQTMNGIANGRILKNVGQAQRSPSGIAFADAATANRFARRVSSFSQAFAGAQSNSAGLAPPTPLSPTSYANLQQPGQGMRQASSSDSDGDNSSHMVPSNNFSPPTTPLYAAQFARSRLGSIAITENTPPQSAPATQQNFSHPSYSTAANLQPPMTSVPMLQSQSHHGFVPMMTNEYPQMSNMVYPHQQQAMHNMEMPMSYIMTNTGEVISGYPLVSPFAQQQPHHQSTPPHPQHPFVPSSNSSPSVMVSSQVPKHSNPTTDFFVHEYTPPQDVKQTATPRKTMETGPKNYTFSNHGPEYFERHGKKHNESSSPSSSAAGSSTT